MLAGGLLLLHDRIPFEGSCAYELRVDVEMWETGSPGVSIVAVTLSFESPRPEDPLVMALFFAQKALHSIERLLQRRELRTNERSVS